MKVHKMTKRLVAKTGTYTNGQNEIKGEYTKVGVLMQSNDGEFLLLDPCVNLAGVLVKQNSLAMQEGKQVRDSVMVSVFEQDNNQQQQGQQQQAPHQKYNNQNNNQPPQQYNQAPQQQYNNRG